MAKAPAFQFYTADWFIDTAQMSREAKGLHIDLMAIQWSNGFVEADEFGFPLGFSESDLGLFKTIKHKYLFADGKLINPKLEEIRAVRSKFATKQSGNGSKGGRPRKNYDFENPDESQEKPKENPNESQIVKINNPEISQKKPLEDEDEDIEDYEEGGTGEETKPPPVFLVPAMLVEWKKHKPGYPEDREKDFPALQSIAEFICNQAHTAYDPRDGDVFEAVMSRWAALAAFIPTHKLFRNYSLAQVDRHSQSILQSLNDNENGTENQPPSGGAGPAPGRTGTYAERMSTARAALAGRLHTKVDSLRPAGEGGVSG